MYEVIFSKKFKQQLKKLEKNLQQRIISGIERTRIRPYFYFQRLVGKETYRLRVGDYRIIADLDGKNLEILVIEIGHRKNIYKS